MVANWQQNVRGLIMVVNTMWTNFFISNLWFWVSNFGYGITRESIVPWHMSLVSSAKVRRNSSQNERLQHTLDISNVLMPTLGFKIHINFNIRKRITKKKVFVLFFDVLDGKICATYTSSNLEPNLLSKRLWVAPLDLNPLLGSHS